jgi:hypothetical protein
MTAASQDRRRAGTIQRKLAVLYPESVCALQH